MGTVFTFRGNRFEARVARHCESPAFGRLSVERLPRLPPSRSNQIRSLPLARLRGFVGDALQEVGQLSLCGRARSGGTVCGRTPWGRCSAPAP